MGPGPDYIAYVFVFLYSTITCRLCKLTLTDQAQVTLQLRFSLSDFLYVFLVGLPFLGGRCNFFFTGAQIHSRRLRSYELYIKTGCHNKKERGDTVHSPCSGQCWAGSYEYRNGSWGSTIPWTLEWLLPCQGRIFITKRRYHCFLSHFFNMENRRGDPLQHPIIRCACNTSTERSMCTKYTAVI